jgi:hypothetical protein
MRPPVVLERSGRPGLDGRTSRFRTRNISLGPNAVESPLLGYKRVQGTLKGRDGKRVTIGRRTYLISAVKYRPYRPHRPQSADFQGFRAGGIIMGYRLPVDRYRAPRQVPTAYRPHKIPLFCRSFSAFGLSRSMRSILYEFFPDGLYCWVKCASALILLPGQHPRTCSATTSIPTGVSAGAARNGAPEAGSVATMAPAEA